jgi:hypothetical protein
MPIDSALESLWQDVVQLNGYAIATRYPTSGISRGFREEAVASAKRVRDFVLDRLT